eukprot:gb/GECH01011275.1/.p1 GENE.gb/GECH01011275.1/~~gb/GECH01011275.1/.p1  ORF type:complete len:840 (+),score=202.14 gb/GECH01011275.1/:1-2520(+)
MVKKVKKGKERLDKYYHLAKEHGYRSRAAFKLIQLNQKYNFLEKSLRTVDLCAAPGGWSQVARKHTPVSGEIVAIDLTPIKHISGVNALVGDITSQKTVKAIHNELGSNKADLVLHDGAPNVGANWFKDAYTQSELVLAAAKCAVAVLREGGCFVTKVFRSADYNSLLWVLQQLFHKVEATKPPASRYSSAEIFVVCDGYKAPRVLDHKLLNPRYVFEQLDTEKPAAPDFEWRKKRGRRNRDGYEEDNLILHKTASVAEFVDTERPVAMLATHNRLDFEADDTSRTYLRHPKTDQEIRILCDDLAVLGRVDFRRLLKWRMQMRRYKNSLQTGLPEDKSEEDMAVEGETDTDAGDANTGMDVGGSSSTQDETSLEEQGEEELLGKLEGLRKEAEKAKKRKLKKARAKLAKMQPRGDGLTERKTDLLDTYKDDDLFNITAIKDKEHLNAALQGRMPKHVERGRDDLYLEEEEKEPEFKSYDEMLESTYDELYNRYVEETSRSNRRSIFKNRKEKEAERNQLYDTLESQHNRGLTGIGDDDDNDEGNNNPLVVSYDQKPKNQTEMWFSQNIFDALKDDDDEEDDEENEGRQVGQKRKRYAMHDDDMQAEYSDNDDEDEDEEDGGDYSQLQPQKPGDKDQDGFEEVPAEMNDPDRAAEVLALGKRMLRKKNRMEFIDDAYNRYAFGDDHEDLPKWFVDDEIRHNKKNLPITKEEVQREKQRFQELNARPMQRVLEAKMRKKVHAQRKLASMRERASQVAESEELTPQEKARELRKIYNQAMGKTKQNKVYVVGRKHLPTRVSGAKSGKAKVVDRRMKADKRGQKAAANRQGRKRRKTKHASRK